MTDADPTDIQRQSSSESICLSLPHGRWNIFLRLQACDDLESTNASGYIAYENSFRCENVKWTWVFSTQGGKRWQLQAPREAQRIAYITQLNHKMS